MPNDDQYLKRMKELSLRAYTADIPVFTDFLTPAEQSDILTCRDIHSAVYFDGGYENAERRMCCFYGGPGPAPAFPISILCIEPLSPKYAEKLSHRDILGAVLSLGIERKLTGDIIPGLERTYIFCACHIADFICGQLKSIRHTSVRATEVFELPALLAAPPAVKELIVPSLRLDAVISRVYGIPRSDAQNAITAAMVYVNSRQMLNTSYILKEDDLVSVRHQGRFRYVSTEGVTKKENLRVSLLVY